MIPFYHPNSAPLYKGGPVEAPGWYCGFRSYDLYVGPFLTSEQARKAFILANVDAAYM